MKARIFSIVLFFCVFLFFSVVLYVNRQIKNIGQRIYPNVYIDNQQVGQKTREEIIASFAVKNQPLQNLYFTVVYNNAPIATLSGIQINLHYDGKHMADMAYRIGRSTQLYARIYQTITGIFSLNRFSLVSPIEYDQSALKDMLTYNEDKYNKPAKNALFKFEQGKVINFRPDEKGLEIESDLFLTKFDRSIQEVKKNPVNKTLELTDHVIEPEITLAHSNNYGIEEFIAEGKSDYSHSIPGRIHNIILASSKFNGVLIPKDKIFSFNETVGDISSLTGYQQAYIIKDGKTILGDGGGVCQVSTTLFRATLNAGLPITERYAHAYRVGYYENDSKPGFDATVFAPYVDFKFKNDTSAYILIQTEVDENQNLLYFRFYGKKDKRTITISPVTIYDVEPPPPPTYQDDPTLKKGVVKQIDFSAWGSKAYFTYTVTKANQPTVTKTFFSSYQPWRAVFLNGTAD